MSKPVTQGGLVSDLDCYHTVLMSMCMYITRLRLLQGKETPVTTAYGIAFFLVIFYTPDMALLQAGGDANRASPATPALLRDVARATHPPGSVANLPCSQPEGVTELPSSPGVHDANSNASVQRALQPDVPTGQLSRGQPEATPDLAGRKRKVLPSLVTTSV